NPLSDCRWILLCSGRYRSNADPYSACCTKQRFPVCRIVQRSNHHAWYNHDIPGCNAALVCIHERNGAFADRGARRSLPIPYLTARLAVHLRTYPPEPLMVHWTRSGCRPDELFFTFNRFTWTRHRLLRSRSSDCQCRNADFRYQLCHYNHFNESTGYDLHENATYDMDNTCRFSAHRIRIPAAYSGHIPAYF